MKHSVFGTSSQNQGVANVDHSEAMASLEAATQAYFQVMAILDEITSKYVQYQYNFTVKYYSSILNWINEDYKSNFKYVYLPEIITIIFVLLFQ